MPVLEDFVAATEAAGIGHGFYYSLTNNYYLSESISARCTWKSRLVLTKAGTGQTRAATTRVPSPPRSRGRPP